jgi:hypothetical protein
MAFPFSNWLRVDGEHAAAAASALILRHGLEYVPVIRIECEEEQTVAVKADIEWT